jgi:hypothetical protein
MDMEGSYMSELIEKFKSGEVAVNCRTEELAKKFLQECEDEGLNRIDKDGYTLLAMFKNYGKNTCYFYRQYVISGNAGYAAENGYEIIEYKE